MKIKSIQIKNLWKKGNIYWELKEDVNILVGNNGSGKSTIIKLINTCLNDEISEEEKKLFGLIDEMIICFTENGEESYIYIDSSGNRMPEKLATRINHNLISTFDVSNSLDELIKEAKIEFLAYDANLAIKMKEYLLKSDIGNLEDRKHLFFKNEIFIEKINELFVGTQKTFSSNQTQDKKYFTFSLNGQSYELNHTQLSSGEKQMFYLMITTMLQEDNAWITFLDEPEISLHIEWQEKLIPMLKELNRNAQLILVTHSPNVFFPTYADNFKRITDITKVRTEQNFVKIQSKEAKISAELKNIIQQNKDKYIQLTKFNIFLNRDFVMLSLDDAKKILSFLSTNKIDADIQTYSILISKQTEEKDAKEIFKKYKEARRTIKTVGKNNVPYNATLKKIDSFKDRLKFIEIMQKDDIELDIITFSTLLGKAQTSEEIETVEEYRKRFGVEKNAIYENKLKIKQ